MTIMIENAGYKCEIAIYQEKRGWQIGMISSPDIKDLNSNLCCNYINFLLEVQRELCRLKKHMLKTPLSE